MAIRIINFTAGEARALLHALEHPSGIPGTCVIMRPAQRSYINRQAADFVRTLKSAAPFVCTAYTPAMRKLDFAILRGCIEGSTYHTLGMHTPQAYNGAVRCLWNARAKIAAAFDLLADSIKFPQV